MSCTVSSPPGPSDGAELVLVLFPLYRWENGDRKRLIFITLDRDSLKKKKSLVNARKGTSIYKTKGWEESQRWGTDVIRIRSGLGTVETRAVGQCRESLAQCRKLLDIIYYLPLWPILGKGTLRSCSMTLETMENNHSLPLRRKSSSRYFQSWRWSRMVR